MPKMRKRIITTMMDAFSQNASDSAKEFAPIRHNAEKSVISPKSVTRMNPLRSTMSPRSIPSSVTSLFFS
jgi:hypothetical protein